MCYRYSVPGPDLLEKKFQAKLKMKFERKFHVSGFDFPKLPVITNEEPKQIDLFHWGLIPFWIKDEKTATEIRQRTANARCETIFEKPSFRQSAKNKKCLVLADGFFEWRYFQGKNYPYYIYLKNKEPFAMAGLWDLWKNPITGEKVYTYTIITTEANPLLAKIHNKKKRMPVILKEYDYKNWLDINLEKEKIMSLLSAYDENEMDAYTISKLITDKEHNPNVSEVLEPFTYKELDSNSGQTSLF